MRQHPTRRGGRSRKDIDANAARTLAAGTRSKNNSSQLKNIRRRYKAALAIKRFACRTRPQNYRVGTSSAAPCQRFVQQSFAESTVPHFRDDIKVGYISMKLRFVNRVGDFLKQLHANMTDQPFAVVEDPAAPRARAGAKTLLHP